MIPGEIHDKVIALERALRHQRETNEELVKALVAIVDEAKWHDLSRCGCTLHRFIFQATAAIAAAREVK